MCICVFELNVYWQAQGKLLLMWGGYLEITSYVAKRWVTLSMRSLQNKAGNTAILITDQNTISTLKMFLFVLKYLYTCPSPKVGDDYIKPLWREFDKTNIKAFKRTAFKTFGHTLRSADWIPVLYQMDVLPSFIKPMELPALFYAKLSSFFVILHQLWPQ